MSAPKIYMSSDANAPVMSGTLGSLVNVLNKCLVAGYGDKSPAGWTMPFVNVEGTKACFRNNATTGTGFFLQVDHSLNATTPTVKAFENMSDVDTGTYNFTSVNYTFKTSSTSGTTARPWILIADDRFFYLFCAATITAFPIIATTRSCAYLLFGDIVSLYPDDGFPCVFGCVDDAYILTPNTQCLYFNGPSSVNQGLSLARKNDGTGANTKCGIVPLCSAESGLPVGHSIGVYNSDAPIILSRVAINNGAGGTIRGYLPGLYTQTITRNNWVTGNVQSVSGRTLFPVTFEGYSPGQFYFMGIDTGDWRV